MDAPFSLRQWFSRMLRPSVNPLPCLVLLLPAWVLLCISGAQGPTTKTFNAVLDSSLPAEVSQPFALSAETGDNTQITFNVGSPRNTSYVFSVELIDSKNVTLLHFDSEGWRSVGTWYEDGYSGTYDESDNHFWVRFKPKESGLYRLKMKLDSLRMLDGSPTAGVINSRIMISTRRMDQGLPAITFFASLILSCLYLHLVYCKSRLRFTVKTDDIESSSRQSRLNYDKGVISLKIRGRYEPLRHGFSSTPPRALIPVEVGLAVIDGKGVIQHQVQVDANLRRSFNDEENFHMLSVPTQYFRLNEPMNLRFRVSIPDAFGILEQEWIRLDIRDQVISPWPVDARRLV